MGNKEQLGICLLFLSLQTHLVLAKDVVTEQHNATVAQRNFDKAMTQFQADEEQVRLCKERVTQAQSQLDEAEKKLEASRKAVVKAQAEHDKQQKILDQAWQK